MGYQYGDQTYAAHAEDIHHRGPGRPRLTNPMIRLTICIGDAQVETLRRLAEAEGRSVGYVAREALKIGMAHFLKQHCAEKEEAVLSRMERELVASSKGQGEDAEGE